MARKPPDPSALIERLKQAKKLIRKGALLNGEEMAAAAGWTWRHLGPQVKADPDWPVHKRGSEGVAWQFDGHRVIDHIIAREQRKLAEREAQQLRLAKLAGIEVDQTARGMSLADLRAVDVLQQSLHRRKIEQGEYVPRAEVVDLLVNLLSLFQSEIMATRAALDPAGLWPPAIAAAVDGRMRDTLIAVHDKAGEFIPRDAGQ